MGISNYQLSESDELDFEAILKKLGIDQTLTVPSNIKSAQIRNKTHVIKKVYESDNIPCPQKKWPHYKQRILRRMDNLEYLVNEVLTSESQSLESISTSEVISYLFEELSDIQRLLNTYRSPNKNKEQF